MSRNLVIGVAGNPNSGKTSLFNCLTGANLKVGNWPGVTVEKREGQVIKNNVKYTFVDIPGTYGFSAASIDEQVAIKFLTEAKPDVVIVVMDSSNFNRNFYLFSILVEMGLKIIPVLNMNDVAIKNGIMIDEIKLNQIFGIPFVKTVAKAHKGIDDLWNIIEKIKDLKCPCKFPSYPEEIENTIKKLQINFKNDFDTRFKVLYALENPQTIKKDSILRTEIMKLQAGIEHALAQTVEDIIAEKRYEFVYSISKECIEVKMNFEDKIAITDKIDRIVTNKYFGFPIFLLAMWLMFTSVYTFGNPIADLIDTFFSSVAGLIKGSSLFSSFIRDGIIGGVGSLLVFVPNIFILFFVIALMEDSGYLARAAFIADKFMHKLGLHGKSFIPMLIGFGCNIPAIMAVRTLETEKDRVLTAMAIPYMSCSARLPVYLLFAGAFFPSHSGTVVFSMYLLGIVVAIFVARSLRYKYFTKEVTPLIMELPAYHVPQLRIAFRSALIRSWFFVKKAGTFIVGAVVVIWILASFPYGVEYASENSLIGMIGSFIAPVFKPAGFGNWQSSVALIFGFLAKEVVISTFGVLYGSEEQLATMLGNDFTNASAISFLVMTLIYIPCVATIAVLKREIGTKWATLSVLISVVLGYVLATIVYQVGRFLF